MSDKKETTNFGDKRNSNGFSNPENRHKAGRPKKNRLADLIKGEIGEAATPSQIQQVSAMLLNMSEQQIYEIIDCKDKDKYPLFVKMLANTLIHESRHKGSDTAIKLIERVAGRAPQSVEIKGEITHKPDISALSDEDKLKMLTILQKIGGTDEDDSENKD
jgi:hypothetical protein